MRKHVRKPPSKMRYEANHPTVSIRVTSDMYDQLTELRAISGKSLGDILREALQKQAPSVKKAFELGFNSARARFSINFPCVVCGKEITVESDATKKAIIQFMRDRRWGHKQCIDSNAGVFFS